MSNDKRKLAVWPDYTWCDYEELEDYFWKSDDYQVVEVSNDLDDDQIETLVNNGELTMNTNKNNIANINLCKLYVNPDEDTSGDFSELMDEAIDSHMSWEDYEGVYIIGVDASLSKKEKEYLMDFFSAWVNKTGAKPKKGLLAMQFTPYKNTDPSASWSIYIYNLREVFEEERMRRNKESLVVHYFTDGACSGNPGPGGWAYIEVNYLDPEDDNGIEEWDNGYEASTTNNQMELAAVYNVVKGEYRKGATICIHTDSKNVIGWLSQGWKRNHPEIKKICSQIDHYVKQKQFTLKFEYVEGHGKSFYNNYVDQMAVKAYKEKK